MDGAVAEVLKESQDGQWVLVRYVSDTQDPALIGTEDLCHENDFSDLVPSRAHG